MKKTMLLACASFGLPLISVMASPPNDLCAAALVISGPNSTNMQSTLLATSTDDPVPSCVNLVANGVWFKYTAPSDGAIVVDTVGSSFDTVLAIYTGACGSLAEIACDDDSGGNLTSKITMSVTWGATYYILAGGYNGDTGDLVFHLESTATAPQCFLPPSGLVSWWSAEGNANDIFGGNPGVLNNGVAFVPGMVGQAFSFNGSNSFVQVADNPNLSPHAGPDGEMTVEAWVKIDRLPPSSGQARRVIVAKGTTSQWEFSLYVRASGAAQFAMWRDLSGNDYANVSGGNLSLSNWHHVAGVISKGRSMSLYVDGVMVALTTTFNGGTAHGTSPLFIGKRGDGQNLDGAIDEVALYNRALGSNEIATIFNAGSAGKCKPAFPVAGLIYTNNFEATVGTEWSATNTDITPVGNRRFLGQFGNQVVTLTFSNLPPHTNLTALFDLFVIRSWDGNNDVVGPDFWDFGLFGQPSLLHTTYSNGNRQSYPDQFPVGDYESPTGEFEKNTLGYLYNSTPANSVYHLSFTLGHTNGDVTFQFKGSGLETLANESWGLDNVVIVADAPVVSLSSPTNGAVFTPLTNLVISANASTTIGVIKQVMFLDNYALLGIVTNNPFSMVWSNVPGGVHVLIARATDNAGRTSESLVTIKVGGLSGEYFTNTSLLGTPFQRVDPVVNFNWAGSSPVYGKVGNFFSAQWAGEIQPKYSETYTFTTDTDDGVRLWIDGQRIIDEWRGQTSPNATHTATVPMQAGRRYAVCMTYFNYKCCGAWARLYWQSQSQAKEILPSSQLFPPVPGANRPPNAPVMAIPSQDGYVVDPLQDLVMIADFFSDPDTGQSQTAADWEIYTATPSNLVWCSYGTTSPNLLTNRLSNGVFTNSYMGLSRLLYGSDYLLRVRHKDNSSATNAWGPWGVRHFNTRPPVIVQQPQNIIAFPDETRSFMVAATNIIPYATYQWYFNSGLIPGATNDTLSLTNIQSAQTGSYLVVVGNAAGNIIAIVSQPATLTINSNFTSLVQSSFDANAEGWTVIGDPTSSTPSFINSGGSPGGFIQTVDRQTGITMYWVAPSKFLGNKSGCYGGHLEFDLRQSTTANQFYNGNVILQGAGITLVFNAAYNPGTTWTFYRISLDENSGWRRDGVTGALATQADILQVLSSLNQLQIRAEFSGSADTDGLDNVMLFAPNCTPATILVIRPLASNAAQLEWPTNACGFALEITASLTTTNWSGGGLPVVTTNGFNTLNVQYTNPSAFFRLRKS